MKNNLQFSIEPNPAKSKTKSLYMCGPKVKTPVYPAPIKLYGRDLPWVEHATHLGHELHQDCSMDMDIRMKRAKFIKNCTDIGDMFSFALPRQVLHAIQVHSAHFYGSMIWDLYGTMATQVYRSWNTCVKLVWDLPRSTHNYFVEHLLASDFRSARKMIFTQYIGFLKRLGSSVSTEVRIMRNIVAMDIGSVTGRNCMNLRNEFSLDPWKESSSSFSRKHQDCQLPDQDKWMLSYLMDLLLQKYEMQACDEDTTIVTGLIESLCST